LLLKVKGRREGVKDVVNEVIGDNTTEQQGEVSCTNMACVVVGLEISPSIG
jgi:hypothetical protein